MVEKICIGRIEAIGEAEDSARISFNLAPYPEQEHGVSGCHSCPNKGCDFRAKATLSFYKPTGDATKIEGEIDGLGYFPSHWRQIEVVGKCSKE